MAKPDQGRRSSLAEQFDLGRALFEIVIVAIGVLLALLVDEARQSRERRQLADESVAAMNAELLDNRSRLVRKIGLLHSAYRQIEADPARAPRLVADKRNQQVTLSQAAWVMTVETGALRLLPPADRTRYAWVYTAQSTYYDILVQEMTHWAALGGLSDSDTSTEAVRERDKAIRIWKTYANRVALGVCISLARTQLTFEPRLPRDRLWASCQAYRLDRPPAALLGQLGVPAQAVGSFL